jgi:hypothetical protein
MAPEALPGVVTSRLIAWYSVAACCCLTIGCLRSVPDISAAWNIDPTPPVAGSATRVRITLQHADGRPVNGARLQLQAHMAHPGMAPVVSAVTERGNGAYESSLQLSMAGDWVFVVTGDLAEGGRIAKEFRVPAVRPAG